MRVRMHASRLHRRVSVHLSKFVRESPCHAHSEDQAKSSTPQLWRGSPQSTWSEFYIEFPPFGENLSFRIYVTDAGITQSRFLEWLLCNSVCLCFVLFRDVYYLYINTTYSFVGCTPHSLARSVQGFPPGALRRIILTASGGAFRDWPAEDLAKVSPRTVYRRLTHGTCLTKPSVP